MSSNSSSLRGLLIQHSTFHHLSRHFSLRVKVLPRPIIHEMGAYPQQEIPFQQYHQLVASVSADLSIQKYRPSSGSRSNWTKTKTRHEIQEWSTQQKSLKKFQPEVKKLLFARELACVGIGIPPERILGAFQLERTRSSSEEFSLQVIGTFIAHDKVANQLNTQDKETLIIQLQRALEQEKITPSL